MLIIIHCYRRVNPQCEWQISALLKNTLKILT